MFFHKKKKEGKKRKIEPSDCLKDWFVKWTQILSLVMIMITMIKTAQNLYQSAEFNL